MGKVSLDKCRSGGDFIAYAMKRGAEIRNGKGSHVIVKTQKGMCVVPIHRELGYGLRMKIIKTFIYIGLVVALTYVVLQVI